MRAADIAERVAGTIQALPQRPVATWPPQVRPVLAVPAGAEWATIEQRVGNSQKELSQLAKKKSLELPRLQRRLKLILLWPSRRYAISKRFCLVFSIL